MKTQSAYYQSPIGYLEIIANDNALVAIKQAQAVPAKAKNNSSTSNKVINQTITELKDYFSGKTKQFSVPISFKGTEFQNKIWNTLLTIPYGQTTSYAEIAKKIGNPKAVRAVGSAIGRNPIPVIIPCHRVITSDGKMGGFAWGIDVKKELLKVER